MNSWVILKTFSAMLLNDGVNKKNFSHVKYIQWSLANSNLDEDNQFELQSDSTNRVSWTYHSPLIFRFFQYLVIWDPFRLNCFFMLFVLPWGTFKGVFWPFFQTRPSSTSFCPLANWFKVLPPHQARLRQFAFRSVHTTFILLTYPLSAITYPSLPESGAPKKKEG